MDAKVYKASLLNSFAAADIATDTSVSPNLYRIPGLFSMQKGQVRGVTREAAVTEVQGIWTLDGTGSVTVVAATKYQIKFGNSGVIEQGYTASLRSYGYTSPLTLSASAATDRYEMYSDLATQINNNNDAFATAYPLISIAHDAEVGVYVVGETVTGGTSGATGIIISEVGNVLTLGMTGDFDTIFVTGEVLTGGTSGATSNSTAGPTNGLGLRIVDDAGYYTPGTRRVGPNGAMATKGFASSQMVNTTAGVVSRGQGAFLLLDVYTQELLSDNRRSGTHEMASNNAPVSGQAYSKYTIVDAPNVFDNGLSNNQTAPQRIQVLYLYEGEADFAATNTAVLGLAANP